MDAFWQTFAADHWERRHLVVDKMFPGPPCSPEVLFAAIVKSCDPALAGPAGISLRYFLGGKPHLEPDRTIAPALRPRLEDGSLEGYRDRIRAQVGTTFGLVVTNLQAIDFELFDFCRRFTRSLYEKVGPPNGGATLEVYFGEQAPFPVHLDPDSVFHMPVYGTKRIRAWGPEAAAAQAKIKGAFPATYEPYLSSSVLLETEPGGVLYWPSTYWHTGENRGKLSASLALSFTVFEDDDRAMMHLLQLATSDDPSREDERELGDFLVEHGGGDFLRRLYLKLDTGSGYLCCPLPDAVGELADDELLVGDPQFPVKHDASADGVDVSANGHLKTYPAGSGVEDVLARLNTGEPSSVAALHGGSSEKRALLGWLVAVRALRRAVTSSGRS